MIKRKIIHKLNIFLILMFVCVFFMSSFNVYALDNQATVEYISIEDFISFNKDTNFSGGDGSKANPYLIKTSDDLAQLSVNVSHINESSVTINSANTYKDKYFKLVNDIDLSKFASAESYQIQNPLTANQRISLEWLPIGGFYFRDTSNSGNTIKDGEIVRASTVCFNGNFDGNGHTIYNLSIDENKDGELKTGFDAEANTSKKKFYEYVGLFGVLGSDATVKNVKLENETINLSSRIPNTNTLYSMSIGGISGCINSFSYDKTNIENCHVNNLAIIGSKNDTDYLMGDKIGGIAGNNIYGGIDNCSVKLKDSNMAISGGDYSEIGGIAGRNSYGVVSNVLAIGQLGALNKSKIGGIIGYNEGNIISAQSKVSVTGFNSNSVGGIAGFSSSKVVNCSAESNIGNTIDISSFIKKSGDQSIANGGIIGYNNGGNILNSRSASAVDIFVDDDKSENTSNLLFGAAGICGVNSGSDNKIDNCYTIKDVIVDAPSSLLTQSPYYKGIVIGNNRGLYIDNVYYSVSGDPIGYNENSDTAVIKTYNKTEEYMKTFEFLSLLNANSEEGYKKWYKTAETKLPSLFNGYGYSSSDKKINLNWYNNNNLFAIGDLTNATNVEFSMKTSAAESITSKELNTIGPKGSILYKNKLTLSKVFYGLDGKNISTQKLNVPVEVSINYAFAKKSGYNYNLVKKYNKKVTKVSYTYKNGIITFKADNLGNGVSYYFVRTVVKPPVPKKTKISSIKNSKKKTAIIKWKKVSGATGYEVYRSTKKTKGYKRVKKTSSTSFTNKKLKKKKTYYYKVRVYKTRYGVSSYSGYSVIRKIKIKK